MASSPITSTTSLRLLLGKVGQIFVKKPIDPPSPTITMVRQKIAPSDRWHTVQILVDQADNTRQISDVISRRYAVSRPLVQRFLRDGKITITRAPKVSIVEGDATPVADMNAIRSWVPRQNMRVETGDLVTMSEVFLPPRQHDLPLRLGTTVLTKKEVEYVRNMVIYKDDKIIIINKPSGLAMHGGHKTETHLAKLLEALRFDYEMSPLIVHRLDRDTSGALVLARTRDAANDLASRFKRSSLDPLIDKVYWALVLGKPDKNHISGEIVSNIYKIAEEPNVRVTSFADRRKDLLDEGKPAITKYRWMQLHRQRRPKIKLSLMELRPITGRTHQLRVHLAEQMRLPILGDYKYFPAQPPNLKLHLHCYRIGLYNWFGEGKHLSVKASIPSHFVKTMCGIPLHLNEIPKFARKRKI